MIITIAQAITAILLIILILLQERTSGLSGVFGGMEGGSYQTRRGLEKFIFFGTIILIVIFIVLSLLRLKL